jgi:hypothetical protein
MPDTCLRVRLPAAVGNGYQGRRVDWNEDQRIDIF